jgi:PAS domain S-box-containing protein
VYFVAEEYIEHMTTTRLAEAPRGVLTWPERAALAAGAFAAAAGIAALLGWALDLPRLTDWKNDGISMFPNAAVCAVLSGVAIMLANPFPERSRPLVRTAALVVALVGALTLGEHVTGIDLGIDALLFTQTWGQGGATDPMRMGPPGSISFLITGAALFLLTCGTQARQVGAVLGMVIVSIGMLSLTGHLYGASQMYTLPRLTAIALPTAAIVVALGVGLLASLPECEPFRTLQERGAAGVLTRRTFPLVVALALGLGVLRIFIEQHGLVDAPFGTALSTLPEIGLIGGLLWWAAAHLHAHEQALRESEAELRRTAAQLGAFLETAPIALHRVGADGSILWANRTELTMLGYAPEEYIGHPVAEFHVDADAVADMIARLRRGETLLEHPARIRCRDGSVKDVVIDASAFWHEGRFVHTQSFMRDVTDAMTTDRARALYAAIIESSDDAIISKDLNGVITSWNEGARRIFGYAAAEAIGRSVTMLMPPERYDEEPGILASVRRGERIDHYETVRRHKDGTLLDISLTVSPICDVHGRIVGASKIARDVTDRKRITAQRDEMLQVAERARDEAEAANRVKDEFLAMLGHELRNPLSAVRNAIAAAILDDVSRARALEIARRQTDQLGRIVDDLLDVARISQQRVRLRKQRLALAEVLQRAVDGVRATMDERGHSLMLATPPQPIRIEGDAARLEQAVTNLLANAAKYTNPGGTIEVIAQQDGAEAIVRVRDNGMGIAPDMLPRIFDLFTQGDRSLDRAQGGLGIGLTLVRRIVELHGGTVEAHSPGIGGGAEFVVRLPALAAQADAAMDRSEALRDRGPVTHPARVLIVEDHPDAAESLVMILELIGHHVRLVHDGVAALEAARANPPDLMLIDIGLPGMNGYELAQAIRRDPALKHLVLVALTGYGQPEDKMQAMAAGFDYHLAKPVDLELLGDLVDRLGSQADMHPQSGLKFDA